jgi:hypothetical protein
MAALPSSWRLRERQPTLHRLAQYSSCLPAQ